MNILLHVYPLFSIETRNLSVHDQPPNLQVFGMKGCPHASILSFFDISTGMIIDEMHAIFEGVVPKILTIWREKLLSTSEVINIH